MKKQKQKFYLQIVSIACLFGACSAPANEVNNSSTEQQKIWSWSGFTKLDAHNPILTPDPNVPFFCPLRQDTVKWESKDVFNPAVIAKNDTLFMLFRAEDQVGKYNGTSRIGLAWSVDGIHFNRYPEPVLYPAPDEMQRYEWEGGCEDPRVVVSPEGVYVMTYTAYDGELARLCLATSKDLVHWEKQGLAFGATYADIWSKSGAIVSKIRDQNIIAEPIDGKYWMYWGDKNLHLATSPDLIHWEPVLEEGEIKSVMAFRPGSFDSDLVESGPPPLLTNEGIVLIYNGRNYGPEQDASLKEGTYCAGQALFAAADPTQLIDRLENPFFCPDKPYEITGQVNLVVFLQAFVLYENEYFLYYGTADSKIAVARLSP